MSTDQSIAEQRDRFLAFAFAASDILMEVNGRREIVFVAGSVRNLLGRTDSQLMGSDIVKLAEPDDQLLLREFLNNLMATGRASDRLIRVVNGNSTVQQVSISGMASPIHSDVFHITFRKIPLAARRAGGQVPESPMSVLDFANSSAMLCGEARQAGESVNFAMYDVDWDHIERTVGATEAEQLNDAFVQTMRAWASGGSGVGQVGKGRYSLLLDDGVDPMKLSNRIAAVAKESHEKLDIMVSQSALQISDVIDTDDFSDMFEQAMARFDEVGGVAFDLTSFEDIKPRGRALEPESIKSTMQKMAAKKAAADRPVTRPARRKGTIEGWG